MSRLSRTELASFARPENRYGFSAFLEPPTPGISKTTLGIGKGRNEFDARADAAEHQQGSARFANRGGSDPDGQAQCRDRVDMHVPPMSEETQAPDRRSLGSAEP